MPGNVKTKVWRPLAPPRCISDANTEHIVSAVAPRVCAELHNSDPPPVHESAIPHPARRQAHNNPTKRPIQVTNNRTIGLIH